MNTEQTWNVKPLVLSLITAGLTFTVPPSMALDNLLSTGETPAFYPEGGILFPVVQEAYVDFSGLAAGTGPCLAGDETIYILGANFDDQVPGTDPLVELGAQGALTICDATDTEILARCPNGLCDIDGEYRLRIVPSQSIPVYVDYDLTIEALPPPDSDDQSLSLNGFQLSIDDGNTVDLFPLFSDNDASNELNTAVSFDGTSLSVTDAGGTRSANISSLSDTPTQVLTKLTTVDGSGSGLDADTLDGQESAAFALAGALAALQATVTTQQASIGALQAQVGVLQSENAAQQTQIATLLTENAQLKNKLAKVSVSADGYQIYIDDANLHIRSGSGSTEGAVNGRGNLIVGYNEFRTYGDESCSLGDRTSQESCVNAGGTWARDHKSGSHNVVIGLKQNYSRHSGLVVGESNTISGLSSSVSGGIGNAATQYGSSVSGGSNNTASSLAASVSGGHQNKAVYVYTSVSGGAYNSANGDAGWVGGGYHNSANGIRYSSVSGGAYNTALAQAASVFGGGGDYATAGNDAYANYSVVVGGYANDAGDPNDTLVGIRGVVVGGELNKTIGEGAVVSGGFDNNASGNYSKVSGGFDGWSEGYSSSVSGGNQSHASGSFSSVSGGIYGHASGGYASVTGGYGNVADGTYASVSGGTQNTASGESASVSGGVFNTADGLDASVSGGGVNEAIGDRASISGGIYNQAAGEEASVSGGRDNIATGDRSSVSGGGFNAAIGTASSLSGGQQKAISTNYSWCAAGYGVCDP